MGGRADTSLAIFSVDGPRSAALHRMPPELVLFVVVAALGGGLLFALRYFSPKARARRRMDAATAATTAELAPGATVKVAGEVVLPDPLESPIGRRPCAYWHVEMTYFESKRSEGTSKQWFWSGEVDARRDFVLRDATGEVPVSLEGAEITVTPSVFRPSNPSVREPLEAHWERFLVEQGRPLVDNKGRPRIWGFEEKVVQAGDRVSVLGTVERVAGGVRLVGTEGAPLLVSEES
jgi:hypothetical protein